MVAELSSTALPQQVYDNENMAANPFLWVNDRSQGFFIFGQNSSSKPICVPNCLTYNRTERSPKSQHPGGLNVCLVDGSVHFVSDTVDVKVWANSLTRSQNKRISENGVYYGDEAECVDAM